MASMKSMIVGVLDVGHTMGQRFAQGDSESKLDISKAFFSRIILQRMIASKTVEFGLVTFGSDETNNFLNNAQGGYENVEEILEMGKPDLGSLQCVHKVSASATRSGDLINGITVGQDILNRVNAKKAYNRIMILITDGETTVDGIEDLETIVLNMNATINFGLYVAMIGKVNESSSLVKKENSKMLQSFAESVKGNFAEVELPSDGLQLLLGGAGMSTKPQMLKTSLELSPQLKFSCVYWSKLSKQSVPTLKKVALAVGQQASSEAVMPSDFGEGDDEGVGAIKRDTTYRNPEDPDIELAPEEKVKGYKYGPQFVPVTAEDEDMFKVKSPASVVAIGTIPAERISRHHFLEGPLFLQGAVDSDAAQVSIAVLSRTLRATNRVLLARFVKRENADPFLAALIPADPCEDVDKDSCLLVHRLPCAEDVREYLFPSLIAFDGGSDALSAQSKLQHMSSFVDAHTVTGSVEKKTLVALNPVLFNVYETVLKKATGALVGALNTSTVLEDTLALPVAHNHALTRNLVDHFPLEKLETKKKRKTYWSEIEVRDENSADAANKAPRMNIALGPSTTQASSRADAPSQSSQDDRTDVESVFSADDVPEFSVGSVAPLEDFQALLQYAAQSFVPQSERQEMVRCAINTLLQISEKHITLGASTAYYKRAVGCIKTAREAAVANHEWNVFNSFLRDKIKLPHQFGRHAGVWNLIVESNVTLISSADVAGSSSNPADAEQFLSMQRESTVSLPSAAAADDEDDLFGSMA